jgi:hypothetical protein
MGEKTNTYIRHPIQSRIEQIKTKYIRGVFYVRCYKNKTPIGRRKVSPKYHHNGLCF